MKKLLAGLVMASACGMTYADSTADTFEAYVDSKGLISLPADFAGSWSHLGSYFVQGAEMTAEGKPNFDVHQVYTQPESVAHYRKTGEFPDGAVLIKTVDGTQHEAMTTGPAHYAADNKVTFVMVKDDNNRFPDNQAWGEGWGWALFTADEPGKNQTTNWKGEGFNNCHGCHLPVKDSGWVYTQGYQSVLGR